MIQTYQSENSNLLLNSFKGSLTGAGFGFILSIGYFAIVTLVTFLTNTSPDPEMIDKYGPMLGYLSYIIAITPWFLLSLIALGALTILPYTFIGLITGLFISFTYSFIKNPTSSRTAILLGTAVSTLLSIGIHVVACTYVDLCINSFGYYILLGYPALVHILSGGCMGWVLFRWQK